MVVVEGVRGIVVGRVRGIVGFLFRDEICGAHDVLRLNLFLAAEAENKDTLDEAVSRALLTPFRIVAARPAMLGAEILLCTVNSLYCTT